jgi:hypothetical protein
LDDNLGLVIFVKDSKFILSFLQSSFLSSYGLLAIYATFVYALGNMLRRCFVDQTYRIPWVDIPNSQRVLEMCLDVYSARLADPPELALEEELYVELLELHRRPEALAKLSRCEDTPHNWHKQCTGYHWKKEQ